jgi:hypothetical protein
MSLVGHELPSRLDWQNDRCTPDSCRLAAPPKASCGRKSGGKAVVLCAAKAKSRTAGYAGSGRVTLAADKVMGKSYDVVHGFANTLSVAPLTFPLRKLG